MLLSTTTCTHSTHKQIEYSSRLISQESETKKDTPIIYHPQFYASHIRHIEQRAQKSLHKTFAKLPFYQSSHENMTHRLLNSPHHSTQRRVRFSAHSLLVITEPVTDEERTISWYSKQERLRLKKLFRYDVRRLVQKLSTKPMASIHPEELYEFVGMEVRSSSLHYCCQL
jgi:hypothetical protein